MRRNGDLSLCILLIVKEISLKNYPITQIRWVCPCGRRYLQDCIYGCVVCMYVHMHVHSAIPNENDP